MDSKKPTPRWWTFLTATLVTAVLVQGYRNLTGEELPQDFIDQLELLFLIVLPVGAGGVLGWLAPKDPRIQDALNRAKAQFKTQPVEIEEEEETYVSREVKPKPKRRTSGPKKH